MGYAARRTLTALSALGLASLILSVPTGAFAASPSPVVPVAPSDSPATIIANAANVVPSARQLAWQRLEETSFIHFGVNTFDGREWGTGTEDPNIFQPSGLNTDQWATSLRDGGFKEAVLTAKHHDGFLLFPSKYTSFSVASDNAWQGGKGDVVKSFTDSMHKYGLKVGIYLSPADLHENQSGGKFANGSPARAVTIPSDSSEVVNGVSFHFNSDDYNTYYENTLYELLTRYGSVDEVWWDGANPTGRNQPYSFSDWISMVRTLQPNASIESDGGPDIRWEGNENATARQSEWSVLPFTGNAATAANTILNVPGGNGANDVGSDALLSQRKGDGTSAWNLLRWTPAECNGTLSAKHNWFWQPGDTWRSQTELENLYYVSVGRNCNFLLDVPPNRQGVFDQSAVTALAQFGKAISSTFGTNLAAGATAANDSGSANGTGHTPDLALDGNLDTSWQLTSTTGALVLTLPAARTFDVISVQEDLNLGQRVESYAVDSWNGSSWSQIGSDTIIGQKKLIRLSSPVTTDRVRLRITGSRAAPAIAEFGLYSRSGPVVPPTATGVQIVGSQSSRCLDVPNASTANGTQLQLQDCGTSAGQRFTYTGSKQLTVYNGSKCLDANGQGTSNGTAVIIWDCNGQANQQWNVTSGGSITGAQSGLCVDANGAGTANGTKIILWSCNSQSNQQWTLRN